MFRRRLLPPEPALLRIFCTVLPRQGEPCPLAVYAGETCLWRRKRPVMAPGEMETVVLKADALAKIPADAANLTVTLEEV